MTSHGALLNGVFVTSGHKNDDELSCPDCKRHVAFYNKGKYHDPLTNIKNPRPGFFHTRKGNECTFYSENATDQQKLLNKSLVRKLSGMTLIDEARSKFLHRLQYDKVNLWEKCCCLTSSQFRIIKTKTGIFEMKGTDIVLIDNEKTLCTFRICEDPPNPSHVVVHDLANDGPLYLIHINEILNATQEREHRRSGIGDMVWLTKCVKPGCDTCIAKEKKRSRENEIFPMILQGDSSICTYSQENDLNRHKRDVLTSILCYGSNGNLYSWRQTARCAERMREEDDEEAYSSNNDTLRNYRRGISNDTGASVCYDLGGAMHLSCHPVYEDLIGFHVNEIGDVKIRLKDRKYEYREPEILKNLCYKMLGCVCSLCSSGGGSVGCNRYQVILE
jgi:hypothetical protein